MLWRERDPLFTVSIFLMHHHMCFYHTVSRDDHNRLRVQQLTYCSLCDFNQPESSLSSSTTLSLPFLCFTLSLWPSSPISLCVPLFTSIQFSWMGFIGMIFDMCHPSTLKQKLINVLINQDVNFPSTLPFCLFSFLSPVGLYWLIWS